jgi:hypothetical protein
MTINGSTGRTMAFAHKNKRNPHQPEKAPAEKSAELNGKQSEHSWMSIRDTLVEALRQLRDVARRRSDNRSMKDIDAVEESLRKLDERVAHHQLPLAAIRITLSDARLDALIVYSQLKMALMYDHQELLAPNEKLRAQVQEYRRTIHDDNDLWLATSTLTREQAMGIVLQDLNILERAERLIREEGSQLWNAPVRVSDSR